MNPMAQVALGSILRWLLSFGAGYLVEANIWTGGEASEYVAAGALALLSLIWSLWEKWWARRKLLVALGLPATTESHVEAHIATAADLPPVTTPKTTIPLVQ